MKLTSSAFTEGNPIPLIYSCQGENISPPLSITNPPKEAKSFALIMDDPDAPSGTFDHWIVWDVPTNQTEWEEGGSFLHQGVNHMNNIGYFGPCPPKGSNPHHYHFHLYALDNELSIKEGGTKQDLLEAMKGHILAEAKLIGTYKKN